MDARSGRDPGQTGLHRSDQPWVARLHEAAAESDRDRLVRQLEAFERDADHGHDLLGETVDDRPGRGVVLGLGEDDRRQLNHAALGDAACVDRLGELHRRLEPEMLRNRALEGRLLAAPVLAPRRCERRGKADVVAAAPVAGRPAERREAGVAPVGRDADAVDPGAADDRDAPAAPSCRRAARRGCRCRP